MVYPYATVNLSPPFIVEKFLQYYAKVLPHWKMCCDLAESLGSIDCEIQPEKNMHFFYCFENIFVITVEPTGPIQVWFSAKCLG